MKLDFRQPTILFGGSFDPVHEGHLHVAREARSALPQFKQIVFVPAAHSPGRPGAIAPAEFRLKLLRTAVEPLGFKVWDLEISRGGTSFTVDTLEEAHAQGAQELLWLLGADAYARFSSWKNPERIRALCHLLVVDRPGQESHSQNPADRFIGIPPHPASSTAIRASLAAGEARPQWLPGAVAASLEKLLPGTNPYVKKI
ncbi:MAG: nicotinate (nicotinamide) nucleotide adenylyltransferase [Bdellovibrionota bacterium]